MKMFTVRSYYAHELTIAANSKEEALEAALDISVSVDTSLGCINYCECMDMEVYDLEEDEE